MILTFAAAAAMAFTPHTDTTFAVPATEARLVIENFAGDVTVGTWSKNSIRIEADHSSRTYVEIERDESTISVKAENRHGVPASVDFRITVPATVAIEISGTYTDVTVEGTRADVSVETVRGDVNVTGGAGHIALQSVEGDVTLEKGRGRAELQSVNAGVRAVGMEGELVVETVNGEITLEDIRGNTVEASTVNGDVLYSGVLRDGGSYRFATHNGDITVSVPSQSNANVSVTTYSGEFDSDFQIKVASSHKNRRMRFTLGTGSAELELESFQGAIHLQKKGDSVVPAEKTKDKTKSKDKMKDESGDPEGKE
jgi:DUF4097 and DUF4098 domain-containing protein YvlB